MPRQLRHADGTTSAYTSVKLSTYSRSMVAKAKGYGMAGELMEVYTELVRAYEQIAQDKEGAWAFRLSDDELDEIEQLESLAHFFLTDPDECDLDTASDCYRDLMPQRAKFEHLYRKLETKEPINDGLV